MKTTIARLSPAGFCLALVLSCTAAAGTYLENIHTDLGSKKPPTVHKMWFEGGRFRSESDDRIAILKDKSLYVLDPKDKTYRVLDKATVERMSNKLAEARKKMDAQLAAMPPERRAMVEKMMGKAGTGPAAATARKRDVQSTVRTETVAGRKCSVWEVHVDGAKDQELCVVPPASIPGGDEMIGTLREVGELFKSFTQNFGGRRDKSSSAWSDLEKVGGLPILSRDFDNGKATSETRLSAARAEAVPGSAFEVPAGYKQQEITGL